MNSRIVVCLLTMLSIETGAAIHAENWPQWRGASHDGISHESSVPVRWSKSENIAWRLPLPGPGGATPIIWNDLIFVTSVDPSGKVFLQCIDTAGKIRWQQELTRGNENARGDEGNWASPSPCTDGEHVWTLVGNGTFSCFTTDGALVWKFNVQERYGKLNIAFGLTSTPVLDKGRLYLQLIHGDGRAETQEAMLVCLDAKTNKEIWKQSRITGATQENEHSYSSPTLYRDKEREYLVSHGGDFVAAHRLQDGEEIWRYCLNPKGALYHTTLRFVASPLATSGWIVAPSAKNGPVVCIKAEAQGDISNNESALQWRRDKGTPDVPSPLYHDGLVYLCRETGNLICVDGKTGKTLYEERTTSDRHRASPVFADGRIYLTARLGIVTVVRVGPTFEILSQNDLGESISASPAIANGRVYLRSYSALYAIGSEEKAGR